MRLLDFNNSYSPTGGGIRVYHHSKMEYYASRGHDIALAVPGASPGLERHGREVIYRLPSVPLFSSGYRLTVQSGPLLDVVNDFSPDLVEIGSPYVAPRLARSVLGTEGIPVVGFFHTNYPESYVRPAVRRLLGEGAACRLTELAWKHVARTYSGMTAVFAASRSVLSALHEVGLRRLFLTPLGVDTDLFRPERRSQAFRRGLGVTGGRKLVLYLARLHWEKGLDLLMDAYPGFRDPSRVVLAIGGRGPLESKLTEFLRRYPEVRRLPYIPHGPEVAEAMASADVFLSLGGTETFGLAGLEAMASGTVTVLPDSFSGGEMATDSGVVPPFAPGSKEALCDAVEQALDASGQATESLRDFALDRGNWQSSFRWMEECCRRVIRARAGGDLNDLEPPGKWWEP